MKEKQYLMEKYINVQSVVGNLNLSIPYAQIPNVELKYVEEKFLVLCKNLH